MPNTQTPPFVSVSGCTKIIYLPAGIKIFYGLDLSQFTYPVLGAYYAITSDGTDGGTLDSLYVYNGSVFVKILEPIDKNVKLASDYNTLGLNAGQSQEDFNKAVAEYKIDSDLKNQEQDSRLENLEGIRYTWSPITRKLTLLDREGNQLSQVSLISLDNEGTDLRYNSSTLSLELYSSDNELLVSIPISSFIGSVGTELHLSSNELQLKDSQGNILSTVTLQIDAKTTESVIATTTVGAVNAGETIPAGINIQDLTELLFNKTIYPTYSAHSFSLTNNAGSLPKEVGSSFSITLTFNFNRGQILGKWVGNIWKEDEKQADRLGSATSYLLNGVSSNPATMTVTTALGTNTLEGTVNYGEGAQPKDSKGDDFESRFPAGYSTQSTSFKGVYPYFYYKSTSPITPEIMQSAISNGQATKVVKDSSGTIEVPFLPNGEYIAVAYPSTSATKTIWFVNAFDSGEIGEGGGVLGGVSELPCNSPTNLWNNIPFKIHVSPGILTQESAVQLKN